MKILCLVKYVPDVDKFKYDFEKNTVVRENVRMILNPDDVCAVALALQVKEKHPDTLVEVVTMAPQSVLPLLEDMIRIGVDNCILITDTIFAGSDSYATSKILSKYLITASYNLILTGTHALDGDTSHIPSQIGELLDLGQMSNVIKVDENQFENNKIIFSVDNEESITTYETELPVILSLVKESKYKLPYINYEDIDKVVMDKIKILSNKDLGFKENEVGMRGSLTKVNRTFVKEYKKRNKTIVTNDEEGIEYVYTFLRDKGFV